MLTFDRAVLIRGVGTGRANVIAKLTEETNNFGVTVELAALIKVDVFARALWGVVLQKMAEPFNRGSFEDTGVAMETTGVVISNEDPGFFTVEANEVVRTGFVGRGCASEGEVDGEALVGLGGSTGGVGASGGLCLFGLDAGWAVVQDRGHMFELRNTVDEFVSIVEVMITGVTEALMPEEALSGSFEGVDVDVGVDIGVKG